MWVEASRAALTEAAPEDTFCGYSQTSSLFQLRMFLKGAGVTWRCETNVDVQSLLGRLGVFWSPWMDFPIQEGRYTKVTRQHWITWMKGGGCFFSPCWLMLTRDKNRICRSSRFPATNVYAFLESEKLLSMVFHHPSETCLKSLRFYIWILPPLPAITAERPRQDDLCGKNKEVGVTSQ